ncbi:MAG: chorismate synthase [Planctomycetota bacterium]|nr:MAG: chorismate synthase [Planctomycetota bacterium]
MGNGFGTLFRVTTFGESHGPGVGCIVEGCPPRLPLDLEDIARDLARRRPGQSPLVSQRREGDRPRILSGVHEGRTLGTPIAIAVDNADPRPRDYDELAEVYRPSHADYTYDAKFGHRDPRGGGRASARETVARVAAGAVARRLLAERAGVEVLAWVAQVADVVADAVDPRGVALADIEASPVRCPDPNVAPRMEERIRAARKAGDSLGGVVALVARGVPPGWGEPVFDKLPARLAAGLLSIPAARGFEVGEGFRAARLRGSEHNDPLRPGPAAGRVSFASNHAGGVLGGISNGEPIVARVAFKPTSTIALPQETVDRRGRARPLAARGRHDPCVLPRAVPVVEAMALLVLADLFLLHEGRCGPAATGRGPLSGDARSASGIAP